MMTYRLVVVRFISVFRAGVQFYVYHRSRGDPVLRRLINMLRQPKLSKEVIDEVVFMLEGECQHVSAVEVPAEATWFLSTNEAVQVCRFSCCWSWCCFCCSFCCCTERGCMNNVVMVM